MLMSDWSSDVCSSDLKAVPVDILGGGYVVAPPSHGGVSAYQFQTGSLDDLPSLPRLKRDVAESDRPATPVELVKIGKRNDSLRSEERSLGNEWVRTCRSRWSPYN